MITAVIEYRNNTLIIELPRGYTDLQSKLHSIGVTTPPRDIKLFGNDDSGINVQLASSDRVSQHLCRLFSEESNLVDVNSIAYLVQNADVTFKSEIEDGIYYDRYVSSADLVTDIQNKITASGTKIIPLYFPLTGNIDLGDHNPFTVGDRFLADYKYDITELIEKNTTQKAKTSVGAYEGDDEGVKNKLASAVWTAESICGVLYGKVNLRLREDLTESETESLKEWIISQNKLFCEEIEGQPIDSEDGLLFISLWHGRNDYFVYDRIELDEYIEQQNTPKMGGM